MCDVPRPDPPPPLIKDGRETRSYERARTDGTPGISPKYTFGLGGAGYTFGLGAGWGLGACGGYVVIF